MDYKTDELLARARRDEDHSSVSAAEKTFAAVAEAEEAFSVLKEKLLTIDEWNAHALLTSFELFDENGRELAGEKIAVGLFLRISLTGTLKYDWVRVERIDDAAPAELVMTVKPTFDPTAAPADRSVVSHFFTDESRNNFCLLRKGNMVGLYVVGLNEKMNAGKTGGALETARNAAVNLGSYLGLQRGEWEKFCHHFLEDYAGGQAA